MPQRIVTECDPAGMFGVTHVKDRVSQQPWGKRNSTESDGPQGLPSIWHLMNTMGICVAEGVGGCTTPRALNVVMSVLVAPTFTVSEVDGIAVIAPDGLEYVAVADIPSVVTPMVPPPAGEQAA